MVDNQSYDDLQRNSQGQKENYQPQEGRFDAPTSEDRGQTQTQSQQQPANRLTQAQEQQPQTRGGIVKQQPKEDIPIPQAAQLGPLSEAKFVPMPTGGLRALAVQLFPDDRDDKEAMDSHVADLLMMNRDVLRDDTSHFVGSQIRIA